MGQKRALLSAFLRGPTCALRRNQRLSRLLCAEVPRDTHRYLGLPTRPTPDMHDRATATCPEVREGSSCDIEQPENVDLILSAQHLRSATSQTNDQQRMRAFSRAICRRSVRRTYPPSSPNPIMLTPALFTTISICPKRALAATSFFVRLTRPSVTSSCMKRSLSVFGKSCPSSFSRERAVAMTRSPRASAACASAWPKPEVVPLWLGKRRVRFRYSLTV